MTAARAAIMRATPIRPDRAGYRAVVFHTDGSTEVSLRLSYDGARNWATQRGAEIRFDENA